MPTWTVHLFAYLKERHGATVNVRAGDTAGEILSALATIGIDARSCRLAVDNEFVTTDTVIDPNSQIAVIPPVSGG